MNGNENKTGSGKKIIGGILLIVLLFIGIKVVFWGLDQVVPPEKLRGRPDVSASQSAPEAPSFCVHCGKALPDSFQWGQFCPYCGEKNEQ